jgi:protein TonB
LPLDQLKFGHLTYQSQGDRVEFRLEVVDGSGAVAEESVLALASPSVAKPAAPTPQQIALAAAAAAAQKSEPAPQKVEEPAQPVRTAPRAFTPPSLQQAPQQRTLVDAPPSLANGPIAVPLINTQLPTAAAPPPPAPAKDTPITQPVQVASSLQASKLVTRITPAYPPLAKSAHVQGTVHMQAVIGRDGAVQNIQVLSGPPLLRPAATDAVKRWVYRPTLLNGQAVEVVTLVDVAFTLGQ